MRKPVKQRGSNLPDPKRVVANWSLVRRDLRDMAAFAREACKPGYNSIVQMACFHACVVAYGRCFENSRGGRPTLRNKHVMRAGVQFVEVWRWLDNERNKSIAHDESTGLAAFGGTSSISGLIISTMISPPENQLEQIAQFADALVREVVEPKIAAAWTQARASLDTP